eukprot:1767495-Rhodomonas_salina.1
MDSSLMLDSAGAVAGAISRLDFSFRASVTLLPGDDITVLLNDFVGPCSQEACPAGYYRSECLLASSSESFCVPCSPSPANSQAGVAAVVDADTCGFVCNAGFWSNGTACLGCAISPCGCTEPANSYVTSEGSTCTWACNQGFWSNGSSCVPCDSTECAIGHYKTNCTGSADAVCMACPSSPAGTSFTSADCGWSCNAGSWLDGSSCSPCTANESTPCPDGFFRGACGPVDDAVCTRCSSMSDLGYLDPLSSSLGSMFPAFAVGGEIDFGYIQSNRGDGLVRLVFSVAAEIPSGRPISVAVPASAGIQIPVEGLEGCMSMGGPGAPVSSCSLLVGTNATAGPSPMSPFRRVPAVGSLGQTSSLTFPGMRGVTDAAPITLEFVPSMPIASNEVASMKLPNFTGTAFTDLPLNISGNGSSVLVSWIPSTYVLRFQFLNAIAAGTWTRISVPAAAGIYLPAEGVRTNQPNIQISFGTVAGPIPWTPIASTQAVGSFYLETELSFGGDAGSAPTSVTASVKPSMDILPGETITLELPGFSGMGSLQAPGLSGPIPARLISPSDVPATASWSGITFELVLTVPVALEAHEVVQIEIPEALPGPTSPGLMLPSNGVFFAD